MAAAPSPIETHGQAWIDFGRLMHVSDTLIRSNSGTPKVLNLNGNLLEGWGAQFTTTARWGDNWEGAFGFGAQKVNHALGKGATSYLAISLFQSFLTQSRLTYFLGEPEAPAFSVTAGSFPYKYQSDVRNLGLYLFRGPVYPGILMGGFQDFSADSTKGTLLGTRIHHAMGNFSHDLILNNEREIPPTLDWSLAYVAKYRAFDALEIGGGANFYRLLPNDPGLATPGHLSETNLTSKALYVEVDSGSTDTVFFTHKGIKLDAFFSLDLKPMFGIESLGPNELKLYGEAAVLGVQNYGKAYNDIKRRIPVMAGFNLPTFRILDLLSFEVEWYGALYRNDLANVGNNNLVADWTTLERRPVPSPKPVSYGDYGIDAQGNWVNSFGDTLNVKGTAMDKENLTTDNLKWSLFLEKSISGHIRFQGQIANDHYRPAPIATGLIASTGGTAEAFSSTKDWYFMLRMGYFF